MTVTVTARPIASPVRMESPRIKRLICEFDYPDNGIAATGDAATGKALKAQNWTIVVGIYHGAESIPPDTQEQQEIDLFLDAAYVFSEGDKTREGLDHIFQKMNSILVDGKLSFASRILKQIDVDRLSPTLLVGFLSITLSTSALLTERPAFYARVRQKIAADRDAESTARLLDKYYGR